MKKSIDLDKGSLIGRTFEEYYRIFRLSDLKSNHVKMLDTVLALVPFVWKH